MALIHPRSLERWQEWQRSRRRARSAVRAVSRAVRSARPGVPSPPPPQYVLHSRESEGTGRILIAVDSDSAGARAALLSSLPYLHASIDVLSPDGLDLPELADPEWRSRRTSLPTDLLDSAHTDAVITMGGHRDVGALAHGWALDADIAAAVVQHEALTPYAAPLPPRSTLLAWTEADAEFRRSGREDIEVRVVGSQLLWQAAHEGTGDQQISDQPPLFLGQPDTPGLPRRRSISAAQSFFRSEQAAYRPDPTDHDPVARGVHAVLRRRGVEIEDPGLPLFVPPRRTVGILAPQLLESAARGVPTWVYGPQMPTWVHEVWERYGLRPWGGPSSPAPVPSDDEPARLIAQILEGNE